MPSKTVSSLFIDSMPEHLHVTSVRTISVHIIRVSLFLSVECVECVSTSPQNNGSKKSSI